MILRHVGVVVSLTAALATVSASCAGKPSDRRSPPDTPEARTPLDQGPATELIDRAIVAAGGIEPWRRIA